MTIELPIIFTILILNLLVVLKIKSRTTMIIVIMLSNLTAILFYSKIISDLQNFKELIIATIIYCSTMLALISSPSHSYNIHENSIKNFRFIISISLIGIFVAVIAFGVFYLTNNIKKVSAQVREKQIIRENEISKNPLIFSGHSVHSNVKKYYLQGNYDEEISSQNNFKTFEIKELYSDSYKQKLRENILFKRLTDAIIIMSGVMVILLLNHRYSKI